MGGNGIARSCRADEPAGRNRKFAQLSASEFIRQVRMIGLIIALGLVSGHPTSARDVDSETAAIRAAILADIERQKIELAPNQN